MEHRNSGEDSESEEDLDEATFFRNLANASLLNKPSCGSTAPEDNASIPLDHIPKDPFFHNDAVISVLRDGHFKVPHWLLLGWLDGEDFLVKRYGLIELSGTLAQEKALWIKRLGLKAAQPDEHIVTLYNDVVLHQKWPPAICDISPETTTNFGIFPSPNPSNILSVTRTNIGYVLSIQDGVIRPWKLLVFDPLTILQIEREAWCSYGNTLVLNLIGKGLPFEVLYKGFLESEPFVPHPGPILHPDGKNPRLVDYFAYRHDLVDLFSAHPHTRAAALCAGGILWRLAVDVLPLPSEAAVVGPFHRSSCISRQINGETYWTPRLTTQEEHVLVGVYRWAESKSTPNTPFATVR